MPGEVEVGEYPNNYGRSEDDSKRFLDEVFGLIPKVSHKVLELRSVVSGEFHDERRSFAF